MDAGIVTAIITGILSLTGVIVTNMMSNSKMQNQMEVSIKLTDSKLTALKESVDKHNNFAMKIPVIENDIKNLKDEIAEIKKK